MSCPSFNNFATLSLRRAVRPGCNRQIVRVLSLAIPDDGVADRREGESRAGDDSGTGDSREQSYGHNKLLHKLLLEKQPKPIDTGILPVLFL